MYVELVPLEFYLSITCYEVDRLLQFLWYQLSKIKKEDQFQSLTYQVTKFEKNGTKKKEKNIIAEARLFQEN